jgi:thiamine pyrophosphokinase
MTNTLPQGVFVLPTATLRAVIFANGQLTDHAAARAAILPGDRLIAADGGLRHLRALGLAPHAVVGDLDSIEPETAASLASAGIRVVQHPARKDETDLELALRLARAEGAQDVLVFGALGGRWDQTLANLLLLANPDFRNTRIRLVDGHQQLYLIQGQTVIEGEPGDTVSLIALNGDAAGVTTTGLEYPLVQGTLPFGGTLGISNVLVGRQATVSVASGLVVCVVAGQASADPHPQLGK